MTFRSDVSVDFSVSPRIATIAIGSTVITIQDLHDTLRTIEAKPQNMSFLKLISSAGKEDLGGGVAVAITTALQNVKLAFAARAGPSFVQCKVSGGNLTAVDANGAAIDPIQTTAFTQVVIAQSSSATVISTGGTSLTATEQSQLKEIHQIHGLETGTPLEVETTRRGAGAGVEQTIAKDIDGKVTVTRA